MKQFCKTHLVPIIFAFILFPLYGQDSDVGENDLGVCVSVSPHLFLIRTLRFDVDKQVHKTNSWLIGSFSITRRYEDLLWGFNFDMMETYGGSLSYRYYPYGSKNRHSFYMQYGVVINYTNVEDKDSQWESTTYNGMEALINVNRKYIDEILQYGADIRVGTMRRCGRNLFFDIYGGIGIRNSKMINQYFTKSYNGEFLSPAYSGLTPLLGFRFGVKF